MLLISCCIQFFRGANGYRLCYEFRAIRQDLFFENVAFKRQKQFEKQNNNEAVAYYS